MDNHNHQNAQRRQARSRPLGDTLSTWMKFIGVITTILIILSFIEGDSPKETDTRNDQVQAKTSVKAANNR